MTKSTHDFTRRAFGQMLGAAAAITPGIAAAASATAQNESVLSLKTVPLSWPQFHKISNFDVAPKVGESVMLKREAHAPFDEEAVAVFSESGQRLGYITRQHNAAISWAMDRGQHHDARISFISKPIVRGRGVSDWGHFHVDVNITGKAIA